MGGVYPPTMLKHAYYSLFADADRRAAIAKLRNLEHKLPSPEARFAVPFVFRGKGHFRSIRPRQTPTEIESLYRAVVALRPDRVLEIGTAKGGTLYLWTQAAAPDATIVSVDLPGGEFGGGYHEQRTPFYQSFARPQQKLHLLRADSHAVSTLATLHRQFADARVDFLFIDGDHRYPGVKADFQQYGPLVRGGGLIAFHDIAPAIHDPTIEVSRLWEELRQRYRVTEWIIPDDAQRRIGIGLLHVPDEGIAP